MGPCLSNAALDSSLIEQCGMWNGSVDEQKWGNLNDGGSACEMAVG